MTVGCAGRLEDFIPRCTNTCSIGWLFLLAYQASGDATSCAEADHAQQAAGGTAPCNFTSYAALQRSLPPYPYTSLNNSGCLNQSTVKGQVTCLEPLSLISQYTAAGLNQQPVARPASRHATAAPNASSTAHTTVQGNQASTRADCTVWVEHVASKHMPQQK
jgi:hypothetical protein